MPDRYNAYTWEFLVDRSFQCQAHESSITTLTPLPEYNLTASLQLQHFVPRFDPEKKKHQHHNITDALRLLITNHKISRSDKYLCARMTLS